MIIPGVAQESMLSTPSAPPVATSETEVRAALARGFPKKAARRSSLGPESEPLFSSTTASTAFTNTLSHSFIKVSFDSDGRSEM